MSSLIDTEAKRIRNDSRVFMQLLPNDSPARSFVISSKGDAILVSIRMRKTIKYQNYENVHNIQKQQTTNSKPSMSRKGNKL